MPPIKKQNMNPPVASNRRVVTRSTVKPLNHEIPKRKAGTPPKQEAEHKRQVLVDITNEKKLQAASENFKNVVGNLKIPNLKPVKPVPKQENSSFRLTRCAIRTTTTTSTTNTRLCVSVNKVKKPGGIPEVKKIVSIPEVKKIDSIPEVKKIVSIPEVKKIVSIPEVKKTVHIPAVKKTVSIPEAKVIVPKSIKSQAPKLNFREVKRRSVSSASSTSSCKGALSRLTIEEDVKSELSGDSEGELFVTVRESITDESSKSSAEISKQSDSECLKTRVVPDGVKDYDKENLNNIAEVGTYAMDIFEYLKSKEKKYKVEDYLHRQNQVGVSSRAQLVDWLVELQEYFELNHESLYLAVKLLDHYLSKITVPLTVLQVVGMSCILLASKYEERYPPSLDDLLFISDYVCTRNQLIKMELKVIQTLNFDMAMPLSYCFLRRYARCIQLPLQDLTLARYILELSLTEYAFVSVSESKMACACLFLALKMLGISGWTPTLEYYTSYKVEDFRELLQPLNEMLHREKCSSRHHRVFVKYSDASFFKVATKKLLKDAFCDGSST